jgi:hypothetical protein
LLALVRHMTTEGFIRTGFEVNLDVANGPGEVITAYESRRAKTRDVLGVEIAQDKL